MIICLTGWQQHKNALSVIAPGATHIDYAACNTLEAAFEELPREPDLAIGWSLGGALLVHAVAKGYCTPGNVLLLSTPFAHKRDDIFIDSYRKQPEATLAQFHTLAGLGDRYARRIIRTLSEGMEIWDNGLFWLETLSVLSCANLDFSTFPKTILVHGASDRIIPPSNSEDFAARLPQSESLFWPDCGHAPHLHAALALRELVEEYV